MLVCTVILKKWETARINTGWRPALTMIDPCASLIVNVGACPLVADGESYEKEYQGVLEVSSFATALPLYLIAAAAVALMDALASIL